MLLTLIPPPSYSVPSILQTHALAVPNNWPKGLKQPAAWIRARNTLRSLGLNLPTTHCADRTSWLSFAIRELIWDLADDLLLVKFVDGTEERWPLETSSPLSSESGSQAAETTATQASFSGLNLDSNRDHSLDVEAIGSPDHERIRRSRGVSPPSDGQAPTRRRPSSPSSSESWETWHTNSPPSSPINGSGILSSRRTSLELRELCRGLCDAHEGFAVGGHQLATEDDLEHLMAMTADPSLEVSSRWYSNEESVPYGDETVEDELEDDHEAERDAQSYSLEYFLGVAHPKNEKRSRINDSSSSETEYDDESTEVHGEFKRSVLSEAIRRLTPGNHDATTGPTWHLPLLISLTKIRRTLIDFYSRVLVPVIKERLDAQTYSIWAISNAAKWCRARAIVKSGEVARQLRSILDHDIDDDMSTPSSLDEDEYDELDLIQATRDRSSASRSSHFDARPSRNVMHEMLDDYNLRLWCERAQERALEMELSGEANSDWGKPKGVPHAYSSGSCVGPVTWVQEIIPIDVAKVFTSNLKGKKSGRAASLKVTLDRRQAQKPVTTKDDQSTPPMTSPPLADQSSEDEEIRYVAAPPSQSLLYLDDPLEEGFLPPRVPRALLDPSNDPALGLESAWIRKKAHNSMNEVAGLTRKLMDLRQAINKMNLSWSSLIEDEKAFKDTPGVTTSGLRNTATIASVAASPPPSPPKAKTKLVPLRAQPLLHRAADRVISQKVNSEVNRQRRSSTMMAELARGPTGDSSSKPRSKSIPTSPNPRKRQRDNLAAIEKVGSSAPKRFVPGRKKPKSSLSDYRYEANPQPRIDENGDPAVKRSQNRLENEQSSASSTSMSMTVSNPPDRPRLTHLPSVDAIRHQVDYHRVSSGSASEESGHFSFAVPARSRSRQPVKADSAMLPTQERSQSNPNQIASNTSSVDEERAEEGEDEEFVAEVHLPKLNEMDQIEDEDEVAPWISKIMTMESTVPNTVGDFPVTDRVPARAPSNFASTFDRGRTSEFAEVEMHLGADESPSVASVPVTRVINSFQAPSFTQLLATLPQTASSISDGRSDTSTTSIVCPVLRSPLPLRPFNFCSTLLSPSPTVTCDLPITSENYGRHSTARVPAPNEMASRGAAEYYASDMTEGV